MFIILSYCGETTGAEFEEATGMGKVLKGQK
jgi:hypothetical protein